MNNCKNCRHGIFNHFWGEYKCILKFRHSTYNETKIGCDSWTEAKDETDSPVRKSEKGD